MSGVRQFVALWDTIQPVEPELGQPNGRWRSTSPLRPPVSGLSVKRCRWPDTLSCGLAGRGQHDRETVGRESKYDRGIAAALRGGAGNRTGAGAPGPFARRRPDGPQGLLKALTKTVIETALDEEMSDHLGYDKHEAVGRNLANSRNGKRSKTLLTSSPGDVQIDMPRDRDGTFEPVIAAKRQRRLSDVDEVVLSLYAKGLTTGEISAHFEQIYGAAVSKDTVSRITDKVIEQMQAWSNRPLERIPAAVFIDAIMVKVRDGQVGNRPVYAAIEVDLDGKKDILGMWAGDGGGESAKFWVAVLTDLKNRGVADVFFVDCDGLKGLPNSVNTIWPMATVQTCIIHLVRGSFRYASRKYRDELSKDLRPIYTATGADAAAAALDALDDKWGKRYPAMIRLWRNAWSEFIPCLDYAHRRTDRRHAHRSGATGRARPRRRRRTGISGRGRPTPSQPS